MLAVSSPEAIGGQAECARMLLTRLDNVEWHSISFPLPGKYRGFSRMLTSLTLLLRSFRLCVVKKVDVVHILTACSRTALFEKFVFASVLKLTGARTLLNFQGALDHHYASFSPGEKKAMRFFLKRIDVLICLHEGMKKFLLDHRLATREKIVVIPNAVAIQPRRPEIKHNHAESIRLAYLGWIIRSKGLDVLVDAASVLVHRMQVKNFSIGITGPEIDKGLVRVLSSQAEEQGVREYISFHPPVTGGEKNDVFEASDVFVFPTRFEGFPFVLLEAMEAGLPVVSTDVMPVNLVVQHGETGLLFDKDNAESLARQIARLAGDRGLRQRLGTAGRQHVAAHYNMEKIIGEYRALYDTF